MINGQSDLRHGLNTNTPPQAMPWARDKMTSTLKGMRARWIDFGCIFEQTGLFFLAEGMALSSSKYALYDWGYANSWLDLSHIYLFNEAIKFNLGQSLYKAVYNHLFGLNIGKLYFLDVTLS